MDPFDVVIGLIKLCFILGAIMLVGMLAKGIVWAWSGVLS